ncbi:MAG TPA: peptidoglycan-associated lipoprotein Pal [Thermoanaerobaculia bacterium]|nr:peptidoglycan-associated lipoprotein Pal [Thermoanaerobaculia bacterium]
MTRSRWIPLVCAAAVSLLPACRAKAPKTTPQAREAAVTSSATAPALPMAESTPAGRADLLSEDLAALNRRGYLKDAYFDYDRAELRPDARQALAADAGWLKKYPSARILVEGHCDERGTEEYNLALGDRRASAVWEYLAAMGVGPTRVRTVSFGKERPFCDEETESCWQENRRGHMVITAR